MTSSLETQIIHSEIFETKKRLYVLLLQLKNRDWTEGDFALGKVLAKDAELNKLFESPT
jgi:hypothetical protein